LLWWKLRSYPRLFVPDRSTEAEDCYRKALMLKSDHVDTNMNMGHMFRLQGRWEEAREKYQVVLKRRSSFAIIRHHLGHVYEQLRLYKVNTYYICLFKSAAQIVSGCRGWIQENIRDSPPSWWHSYCSSKTAVLNKWYQELWFVNEPTKAS